MTITDGVNTWTLELTDFKVRHDDCHVEIEGTYEGPYAPMGDLFQGKGLYSHWEKYRDIEIGGVWFRRFEYLGINTQPGSFLIRGRYVRP